MHVAEIHFNHDTASASNDAINLRHDGTAGTEIAAPEWVHGDEPQPVAYAAGAITGPVTIKVKFKDGPPNERVSIRAILPSDSVRGPLRNRSAIGPVRKRLVQFDAAGHSGLQTFELQRDLSTARTGAFDTRWEWQAFINGDWVTFAGTENRTYVVPDLPTAPWNQRVGANPGWPWVAALNKACSWAFGAATVDEAAAAIASALNSHPKHTYDEDGVQFAPTKLGPFDLTTYLSELSTAASFIIDCRGVASAMVTFANLMGATLLPLQVENGNSTFFSTKSIKPLNAAFMVTEWGRHEIAVMADPVLVPNTALTGGAGSSVLIYDANLRVNQLAPILPIQMPLGSVSGGDYRFHLIDSAIDGDDGDKVTPLPVRPVV